MELSETSHDSVFVLSISPKLQTLNGGFEVVINGRSYNFRLQLKEKWKQENSLTTMVGASIDDAAWDLGRDDITSRTSKWSDPVESLPNLCRKEGCCKRATQSATPAKLRRLLS